MKTGAIDQLGVIMRPGMPIRKSKKSTENTDNNDLNSGKKPDGVFTFVNKIKISVKELKIFANIGVYQYEKTAPQELIIDIDVFTNINKSIENDDINNTIDYVKLANLANITAQKQHFNLIETFAQALANEILQDTRIEKLELKITKPSAIKNAHSAQVLLECARNI